MTDERRTLYHELAVCVDCGKLCGPARDEETREILGRQRCRCEPSSNERWPRRDFPRVAMLCSCCAQVVLPAGSRWDQWFCRDDCREQVRLLNARLGRYAVPIGPHSMMGGIEITSDADAVEIETFGFTCTNIFNVAMLLVEWNKHVGRTIIAERWQDPPRRIPLDNYLARWNWEKFSERPRQPGSRWPLLPPPPSASKGGAFEQAAPCRGDPERRWHVTAAAGP